MKTDKQVSADVERVLLDEAQLHEIVERIAAQIDRDYRDCAQPLLLVGILNGSVVFFSDLIRALHIPCCIDFMSVKSYVGTEPSGEPEIRLDLKEPIAGRHVLLVEDILDTGHTLDALRGILSKRDPASIKICTLLDKPSRREVQTMQADYVGKVIPDEFVVGYGLDYDEKYRNLPYVGILRSSVYEHKE
ncbi:MAG TPA: hypoxanthine phosphoribosyltransferase [Candidatus Fimenecus stercoravium]|nr:hypoxanthine phosphoribosyltransferase [Candidatus Fimenecus stercoravium]